MTGSARRESIDRSGPPPSARAPRPTAFWPAPALRLADVLLGASLLACQQEAHALHPPPGRPVREGTPSPGHAQAAPWSNANPYADNGYALAQGNVWFSSFNCVGCHGHGGGGIGPALMDAHWI